MLEFTEGEELTLSGYLDPEYRSDVSGIIKIYRIEPHSSIRNNQSIPMANRYMGSVPGQEIDALQPGEWFNLTLNPPEEGESYVAVLESDEGKIINSVALEPGPAPMAFITDDQVVRRIDPSSSGTFILTVDRFQFEEEDFGEIEINISSSNIPEGWSLTIEGAQITQEITKLVFGFQGSSKEIKPAGRVRYYQNYQVTVNVPEEVSGNFDFDIGIVIGSDVYDLLVVVIVPEPTKPDAEILDIYLEGSGKTIYFYVEAKYISEDGTVKGTVLPCNYGPGAACGLPVEYLLTYFEGDLYRAALVGIDLETYTHLTYSAWVEEDGIVVDETEEKQVEISSLIDIGAIDDDDEDELSAMVVVFSIAALLVVVALVILVIFIARRSKEEDEEEEPPIEEVMGESLDASPAGDISLADEDDKKKIPEDIPAEEPSERVSSDSGRGPSEE
ncbi:MAG: hypothetical protein ACMUHY_09195, partial [Thermoplasmatota archaeon]